MKITKMKKFNTKKRKRGFTLIEILAVIIILGILVIIAIPAVTKYIEGSRRSAYIDTAKQIISGARNMVNDGKMDLYNTDVTYYVPISCIKSENDKKSINGKFTLAYVGVVYDGKGFNYYWTSVDGEGEGIKELTSYDELDEDDIESGIQLSDIDTSISIGGRSKTFVYNNDCTEVQENDGHLVVSFDAGEGEYSNGSKVNKLKYQLPLNVKEQVVKYSHTQNVNDQGEKLSDYGHYWTNANITGTDRGDTSKAHVITIPGEEYLDVDIYYNGESCCDWATVWEGSHPDYTAASNYSSGVVDGRQLNSSWSDNYTVNGILLSRVGKKSFRINGDSVTFGYKSDGSVVGDGYGYYAIVKTISDISFDGNYEIPTREDYIFDGWEKGGKTYNEIGELIPTDNETYTAKWVPISKLEFQPNGGYMYVDGQYLNTTKEYTKKAGETISYTNVYRSSTNYSNGSYTTSFNSNGGNTTPSSIKSTIYYTCSYNYTGWSLKGDCDNVLTTSNTNSTYTFPDSPGDKCVMSANYSSSCGGNWTYSIKLPAAPQKEGYVFLGWKSSSTGAIYPAESIYTPNVTTTLTAQWESSQLNVTFDANGGKFDNGNTTYSLTYNQNTTSYQNYRYYSHTSNVNDNGSKLSNYGNNWNNNNIRGTGRTGALPDAHVVTVPGAKYLTVDIYYNGESTTYDWVTVWAGSHPNYTAYNNSSSGISGAQKLGGYFYKTYNVNGYSIVNADKKSFTVDGDSVTFGFRSDGSGVGQGYGYYAVIFASIPNFGSFNGTVKTPTRSGYRFIGWKSSIDNRIYSDITSIDITKDMTLTAQWIVPNNNKICKRATTLHTGVCARTDTYGCNDTGQIGTGGTITYGRLGTSGRLQAGDAFDCDVNDDGIYDPTTERFYYVTSDSDNDQNAVLVYYNSVAGGVPNNTNNYYYSDSNNYNGPRYVYQQLPTTSQWKNIQIIAPRKRQIYNEDGGLYSGNGSHALPRFDYGDKAARLLTAQELIAACGLYRPGQHGYLDGKCEFFIENTSFENPNYIGYTSFETVSSSTAEHYVGIQAIHRIKANALIAYLSWEGSARPVITVSKYDIDY